MPSSRREFLETLSLATTLGLAGNAIWQTALAAEEPARDTNPPKDAPRELRPTVILQDLGVYRAIRQFFPRLELHGSTQMAVHNRAGVETLPARSV